MFSDGWFIACPIEVRPTTSEQKEKTMNRYSTENYKMLTRVANFAANNAALFNKSAVSAEIQASLNTVIGELAGLSSARISAENTLRTARNERYTARNILRGLLTQAEMTARALNNDKFRSPRRATDQDLIESARASAAEIESLKKEFSVYAPLTEDVTPAVQALERAVLAYGSARAGRSAAIQEFGEKLEVAMGHLRRLEAVAAITLAGNTKAMAEWTLARTVNRTPRRRIVEEPKAA
jgi:hypothetical protein